MQKSSFIQSGKKTREELYLPPLRFVVTDNWVDVLGHDAFIAWLKFHTWVDRRDEDRENDRIPYSLEDVWAKLGIGKKKFYEKIARPLWEYGLIDIVEYEGSNRKSQKPKNIIVYTSPANTHETETKPLEKLRDWSKNYGSISQFYGKKGGRPKKEKDNVDNTDDFSPVGDGFQTETVESTVSKQKPSTVSKQKPSTVSKQKPNNVSNALTNVSNALTNVSNNNPDQPGGTQAKTEKQKNVVVVEVQSTWKDSFGTSLPATKARLLLKDANQNTKIVVDAIKKVKRLKKDNNPIGAVRYELQYGWDEVPEKKDKPAPAGSQKNDDLDGLPSAFQKEAMTDEEKQKELEVDPEIQAQLEARLYRMRERLEEAKIKKKGVFAEKA